MNSLASYFFTVVVLLTPQCCGDDGSFPTDESTLYTDTALSPLFVSPPAAGWSLPAVRSTPNISTFHC